MLAGLVGMAALMLVSSPAQARESLYRCDDKTEILVGFTPDRAQVRRGEQHWTLARVRAAGAAVYVNRRDKVKLATIGKQALLTVQGKELYCAFIVQP